MSENPAETDSSIKMPIWLRLSCLVFAILIITFLLIKREENHAASSDPDPEKQKIIKSFPKNLSTIWTDIKIDIESVAQISSQMIIAEWNYINTNEDMSQSFSWGFAQPNFVAESTLIDATGREFKVHINTSKLPACSSTNKESDENWSKELFGGRDLPAWAQFKIPENLQKPIQIKLYGVNENGIHTVNVPVLSIREQIKRMYQEKETNWPDIYLELKDIKKRDNNTFEVSWYYVNRNPDERFIWGLNQPNYVARTQLYDFKTGKYHNVHRVFENGKVRFLCSSTNKDDNPGWSKAIPPNGKIEANAIFKGVPGKNIQILFHSAMPLFYNPPRNDEKKKRVTN